MLDIRLIDQMDAEEYKRLRLQALKTNPEAFASSYEEEYDNSVEFYQNGLQSNYSYSFGAFEENKLVGTVSMIRETKQKMSHRANIFAMYVTPAMRGYGLGKKLMQKAVDQAKQLDGVEQIYLTVVTKNSAAKRLYASLGFETFGHDRQALYVNGTYLDEELMVLFLSD
ncbi:GNAT family N-acetyltransferase [Evansella halocellulosilytica]|uniref:GNAT family N-acetyltransferase n=1 Tax=Evansella halocellulosilytica TaxID=2011013 RepID=UPI0027BA3613|nr:GNAT family N-acetyltransferase [Evansella halocellulosilytica]